MMDTPVQGPGAQPSHPPLAARNAGSAELAVIIPTLNERQNIVPLLERLDRALAGASWEAIFVDDESSDGTADEIRKAALLDRRVRCIRRIGRRGLTSACMEGMASTAAEYLAVMDADLQHAPEVVPQLLAAVRDEGYDVAVASRYVSGGGVADGWARWRRVFSQGATRLAGRVIGGGLADPMSGFFLVRRGVFWSAVRSMSGRGFKVLLDLLASAPTAPRVKEIPFRFAVRVAGESKLDTWVAMEYFLLLADKTVGRVLPIGFVTFVVMGCFGAVVHLAILWELYLRLGRGFPVSQATAALCAMCVNFVLNNKFTYSDRRLRGAAMFRRGLLFVAVCSVGAGTSVQLAAYLLRHGIPWWLAGSCGAGVGAVWNYSVSTHAVWRKR